MAEFGERETCDFFGHLALLSIDERNDLDAYLRGLPEFMEWDEAGFLLGVKQKLLKASASSGATATSIDDACNMLRTDFRSYKELEKVLRAKTKAWCRAMVDEVA